MDPDDGLEPTGDVELMIGEAATVITLVGDVDRVINDDLDRVRAEVARRPQPIVVDTSGVEFMDSVGVAFLVQLAATAAHEQPGGGRPSPDVVLREPAPCVLDLLQITGSLPLFEVTRAGEQSGGLP